MSKHPISPRIVAANIGPIPGIDFKSFTRANMSADFSIAFLRFWIWESRFSMVIRNMLRLKIFAGKMVG